MPEVMDRFPGPDVLAEHREAYERTMAELTDRKRQVAEMRLAGMDNGEIAHLMGLSQARTSQIAREIVERFRE